MLKKIGIVMVALLAFAACGGSTQPAGEGPGPAESPNAGLPAIGETVTMSDGRTVTLHTVNNPATEVDARLTQFRPLDDPLFVDTEVEVCAPDGAALPLDFSAWTVWLDTNAQATRHDGMKEPKFATGSLPPGQCARAWIVWEGPEGSRATSVTYQGAGPEGLQWKLS